MIAPFPYKWAKFGIGYVRRLQPAAWFRFSMGITVTGAGVSQWDDQSGNGRHLKQGTDANRPALQSDGSILFDGVDNYLKCDAFTLAQPYTRYFLLKQITWTLNDVMADGNSAATGQFYQSDTSPDVRVFASAALETSAFAVGAFGIVSHVMNGASSVLQVNNEPPVEGNVGAGNPGGFTLGARGDATAFANIQVKEVLIYPEAHDATQRIRIARYLTRVGEMGLLQ